MSRKTIIKAVALETGFSVSKATKIVNSIFNTMVSSLHELPDKEYLVVRGFGKFRVKVTKKREVSQLPTTGPSIIYPRHRIFFKASPKLKAAVNHGD
uniref:Integration host factor subunit beta n=1 Tax=uncultured marine virus TaxID=186617 RepID=A0A0F7L729_9VIRU|nr:hypothetical protein [uncultured marine virus]